MDREQTFLHAVLAEAQASEMSAYVCLDRLSELAEQLLVCVSVTSVCCCHEF
jgi:hypothetical protein